MTTTELRDGMVLELTVEIVNTEADRRVRRDWTKEPTFKPGRYIVDARSYHIGADPVFEVSQEGDRYRILHKINPRHPAWDIFLASCRPAIETLTTVLTVNSAEHWT